MATLLLNRTQRSSVSQPVFHPMKTMKTTTTMMMIVIMMTVHVSSVAATCSICGVYGPSRVPFPEKSLPDVAGPLSRCVDLDESSRFVEPGTQICDSLQAMGTFCGCNRPPEACLLCWDGSPVIHKNLTLPGYSASAFVNTFGFDSTLSCELLEAYLHTTRTRNTDQCLDIQIDVGERCGCPPLPQDMLPIHHNSTNTTDINPGQDNNNSTATPDRDAPNTPDRRRCTICENGDPPPFPNIPVDVGQERTLSCAGWDAYAQSFEEGSSDCSLIRSGASRICQCPRPEGQCTMCPLGEAIPKPQQELNWLTDSFLSSVRDTVVVEGAGFLNCQLMESHVASGYPLLAEVFGTEEELLCTAMQMKSWICGCKPDWRQIALTWCYRLSGMCSLIVSCTQCITCAKFCSLYIVLTVLFFQGSGLIIISILRKPNSRFTTYHQLVLGISAFDMISSIAYMLVGVMAPYEAGFYLSRGNETTCKMQGFMIQLGQTASMFYNLCLSLYFFTVIMLSWREDFLRKILVGAHFCVIAIGLGLSIGAIPYYEAQFGVCGILPPLTASQWQVSLFYTVPVSVVLIVLTAVTISICYRVYSQHARVSRWRTDKRASVTRKVFWQSAWYVSAFYVTLPFVLLSFYVKFKSPRYFWIYIVTAILAPLQGLMNALIYFQRSRDFRSYWSRLFCCTRTEQPVGSMNRRRMSTGFSNNFSNNFSHTFQPEPSTDSIGAFPPDVSDEKAADGPNSSDPEIDEGEKRAAAHLPSNVLYLQDDDDDDYVAESTEQGRHGYNEDPLTGSDSSEVNSAVPPRRRSEDLERLQEMTQPVSSLQTFLRRGNNNARVRERTQQLDGVLEYWNLHEEDSSLTTRTTATTSSGRLAI